MKLKYINTRIIDGQVCLARLQADKFRLFFIKKWKTTKVRLNDKQTVNRLRKIACMSFRLPFDVFMFMYPRLYVSMSPCLHVSMTPSSCLHVLVSTFRNSANGNRLTENGNLVCFLQTETANFRFFAAYRNGKWSFVFLGRQTINDGRRLLFQQTLPSMTTIRITRKQQISSRTTTMKKI
jgi:hypothetical protein